MDDVLFCSSDWHSTKDRQLAAMRDEIDAIDGNRLLNTSVGDLCEFFVQKYRIDVPTLHEAAITADQREAKVDVSGDYRRLILDRSRPAYVRGAVIEIDIPFDGDAGMFNIRPSTYTLNPPRARVTEKSRILRIHLEGADLDKEQVRRDIDGTIASIKEYLDWQRRDVVAFDTELRSAVEKHIKDRREKLLNNQSLVSSLGFPLRERKDAAKTFSVPSVRRRVTPAMPTASTEPFTPEPALPDDEFEHIIAVIEKMSTVMELSPGAFSPMDEEALRTHILVQLNGHYEGNATGETFNFLGKTDILIRVDGKNIFIAECKFWRGPKALARAIDQLLGYASWRDTKVAIVLFNRQKNFTGVLQAIPEVVEQHRSYKRPARDARSGEFRYVLGHRDDPNRELTLAVVAFEVPAE